MKCQSCDIILTDFEATRKYAGTHEYVDLCNTCIELCEEGFKYAITGRPDLMKEEDTMIDMDMDYDQFI